MFLSAWIFCSIELESTKYFAYITFLLRNMFLQNLYTVCSHIFMLFWLTLTEVPSSLCVHIYSWFSDWHSQRCRLYCVFTYIHAFLIDTHRGAVFTVCSHIFMLFWLTLIEVPSLLCVHIYSCSSDWSLVIATLPVFLFLFLYFLSGWLVLSSLLWICTGPVALLEFRIWKQGRVNIESLTQKLKASVRHATWDLLIEFRLLTTPLCIPSPTATSTLLPSGSSEPSTPIKGKSLTITLL
jgi:hypothetical protein